LALENTVHPIKVYLQQLVWDRTPRIRNFFSDYMGAKNSPLNQEIAFIMFVAAVRRIYQPGSKFDTMVVLEGKQGTGKSTALKILATEEDFSDQDIIAADSKTQMELLEGVWIYELCELSGMRHTDVGKMKSFLSRQEDRGRPAYGRYKEVIKRQSIFVGTTNDQTYLKDKTGNRRYLPVATGAIDLKGVERDRDQLWAEALHWEKKGASIFLPEEFWAAAAREQEARVYQDPWEDLLSEINDTRVGKERRVFTKTLLQHLEIPASQQQHFQTTRLAECMRNLGWSGPKRIRIDGVSLMGYWRTSTGAGDDNDGLF
ncbi:MAG: virulence-associated E family protein, partial [Sneathiella sp.]